MENLSISIGGDSSNVHNSLIIKNKKVLSGHRCEGGRDPEIPLASNIFSRVALHSG